MHKWFSQVVLSRRKILIIVGVLFALALIGIGVWSFYLLTTKKSQPSNPAQYTEVIKKLESQSPPKDPLERAIYYGQLGQSYRDINEIDIALDNFLMAQKILDDNKLSSPYVFYQAIADTYKIKGNKTQEKLYLEKQLKFLQESLQTNPNDGGATLDGIKVVEERLKLL